MSMEDFAEMNKGHGIDAERLWAGEKNIVPCSNNVGEEINDIKLTATIGGKVC